MRYSSELVRYVEGLCLTLHLQHAHSGVRLQGLLAAILSVCVCMCVFQFQFGFQSSRIKPSTGLHIQENRTGPDSACIAGNLNPPKGLNPEALQP